MQKKKKKERTKKEQRSPKQDERQNVTKAFKPEMYNNIVIPYKILVAAIRNAIKPN